MRTRWGRLLGRGALRLGIAALLLIGIACGKSSEPLVLVISIDTLRRDHVSAYGYERETTPNLDRLAAEGAIFDTAVSTSNWTLPSHMSLFTGFSPSSHQVEDDRDRLPNSVGTLAEAFKRAGYETAAFTSHLYLDGRFGFRRGFDLYQTVVNRRAQDVSDRALLWLQRHEQAPAFLFLHYFDPHWDYAPPPDFAKRFGEADPLYGTFSFLKPHLARLDLSPAIMRQIHTLYDAEIAYTDHHIGRVLDWLRAQGRLEDAVVVVLSDHGEEFGEHGALGHGGSLHGEVTRVPLIIRHPPSIRAGTRITALATLKDIPATLLALAGVTAVPQFLEEGQVLIRRPGSAAPQEDRIAILESTRWGPKRFAVRSLRYKLMSGSHFAPPILIMQLDGLVSRELDPVELAPGFYDLERDPGESNNLLQSNAESAAREPLDAALLDFLATRTRGLLLACRPVGDRVVRHSITLDLDTPPIDEPFALGGSVVPVSATSFRVVLEADARSAYVVLIVEEGTSSLSITFDGGTAKQVSTPAPGETIPLLPAQDGGPALCTLGMPHGVDVKGRGAVELSPDEINRLEALGYAQ